MHGKNRKNSSDHHSGFYPRGTQRMLRFLFGPKKLRIRDTVGFNGGLRMNVDTSSYVEWNIFFSGNYEKNVTDIFEKLIKPGFTAVDAGAYIGTHTLVMAKLVGETGRVLAFEPNPDVAGKLDENIRLNNFANVKVFRLALSDKEGKMHLFTYGDQMLDKGTSSLYELNNLEDKFEVEVFTLDRVVRDEKLARLDLIKIDTRGSDLPIIRGAEGSIKKFNPFVVFEYNADNWSHSGSKWEEAGDFFSGNNYSLFLIGKSGLTPIMEEPKVKTSHNILAAPSNIKIN
ncbi:FkbM family methyltransferase [bacterium]|nr:MAG: FkbM family methyltransferase [bacterium]